MSLLAKNRNFRLLFSASAVSNLGDGVSALAFPWLATIITRDPVLIAIVAAATRLPWLLFAIPAGVITDRADRRQLMVIADVVRLLLTTGVIGLILTLPSAPRDHGEVYYIAILSALAFLLGTAEVVRDNAAQTALPSIVSPGELERANGQLWSIEQIMGSFVGPPLAGALIAWSIPLPFAFDALTFAVAAWAIWLIAVPPRVLPPRKPIRHEVVEGFRFLWSHVPLRRLALMLAAINAIVTATMTVLVLVSQEILGLGGLGHGILLAAGAAGGVVGGLVCPSIAARLGPQRSVFLAMAVFPFSFLIIGLTAQPVFVALALFVEMFAALLWNVVTVSYRQRLIPDEILGRVNSIYRFFAWGLMPLGAVLGGMAVDWGQVVMDREEALRLPYLVSFVLTVLLALYGFARLRLEPVSRA